MGRKTALLLVATVLVACYVYTPLPDTIDEPWRLIWINTQMKFFIDLASFVELLGFGHSVSILGFIMHFGDIPPTSDENVTVTDTTFNSVSVRVYEPKHKSETLRRGLVYIHGGGWGLGSPAFYIYDSQSRRTADRLNAVVVSVNYRLAPKYHFPSQFEDVYSALQWFLRQDVLEKYSVDPQRVGVSGDSAGGNLAAAVTQEVTKDPDFNIKPKVQVLVYPALQVLDMDLPSHRENSHIPLLAKSYLVRLWSEYFTPDKALQQAMLSNQHIPREAGHLFQFLNWSSLLPERFKKDHVYKSPTPGSSELVTKYPGLLDVRASPLLAEDSTLRRLPLTYVITCQYDVLRDEGVMYVTRLQNAGVQVTHHHIEDGFHGAFSYNELKIAQRMENQYMNWLMENL